MTSEHRNDTERSSNERPRTAVSLVLSDGTLVETVYLEAQHKTVFCISRDGVIDQQPFFMSEGARVVPYSPNNNLLKHSVVLFPSGPEEYGTEGELVGEIQSFIHRYVDVSPLFEKIASYYVLLSWVYDAFTELPYLRLRGDPGSGKTRFLLTVGSLCYKPIFASGASTVSPIFRILDAVRGTLIVDEGDFRFSDEQAEIVKILNNGNAKGFPVLRSESSGTKEYSPRAYAVYGPKIVATRNFFQDRALESRCLTEEMGQFNLRTDIPINLSSSYKEEALHLRNKLLLFRFRTFHTWKTSDALVDRTIEPRLNQIFVPLLSVIEDQEARKDLRDLARRYNREMIADRGMEVEAQVLGVICDMLKDEEETLSVRTITRWFQGRHEDDYERKITSKWIGSVIRTRLHLKTQKSNGVFVIARSEEPKLQRLFEKYGIRDSLAATSEELPFESPQEYSGDFGDVGDFEPGDGEIPRQEK